MKGDSRRRALAIAVASAVAIASAATPALAVGAPEAGARLAYVDPGSGSFILQALVAALAGLAVAINAYWRKIKQVLGFGAPKQDEDAEGTHPSDD
jgi:hypothetical protein